MTACLSTPMDLNCLIADGLVAAVLGVCVCVSIGKVVDTRSSPFSSTPTRSVSAFTILPLRDHNYLTLHHLKCLELAITGAGGPSRTQWDKQRMQQQQQQQQQPHASSMQSQSTMSQPQALSSSGFMRGPGPSRFPPMQQQQAQAPLQQPMQPQTMMSMQQQAQFGGMPQLPAQLLQSRPVGPTPPGRMQPPSFPQSGGAAARIANVNVDRMLGLFHGQFKCNMASLLHGLLILHSRFPPACPACLSVCPVSPPSHLHAVLPTHTHRDGEASW